MAERKSTVGAVEMFGLRAVPRDWRALVNTLSALPEPLRASGGVIVAFAAVAMLGLLVLPVTPAAMDVLVGLNISLAATLLLVSLFMPDAARFPSFPTILLLTTLYRLALNVSSTRLILGQADAGQIIAAFGNFVVAGNYVVGGVIFLILTVIQFVVIAKGSERVAEVSARFTLDAMQGKQLAIDAELNQGLITPDQARQRRRALDRESRLYGAMDGAMKFVKGDAIAGILISAINIVGGLVIGVMQMGMSLADAAQTFTLLTIGDGLVSQIPALLISTAAGIIVTRVAGGRDAEHSAAGHDIVDQVLSQPVALICVATVLLLFAAIPGTGMPWPVFVAIALVLLVLSVPGVIRKRLGIGGVAHAEPAQGEPAQADDASTSARRGSDNALGCANAEAIVLELGGAWSALLAEAGGAAELQAELSRGCEHLRKQTGVPIPLKIDIAMTTQLEPEAYRVRIFGQLVATGTFDPQRALLMCSPSEARGHGLDVEPTVVPWNIRLACTAPRALVERGQQRHLTVLLPKAYLGRHVRSVIGHHAHEFLGIQGTKKLLTSYEKLMPDLVAEVVPKRISLAALAATLEQLVQDHVPISSLHRILELLARHATPQSDPAMLAEQLRPRLARVIFDAAAAGGQALWAYRLSPSVETDLAQYGPSPGGIDPHVRDRLCAQFIKALLRRPAQAVEPVLLTRRELRLRVRDLLRSELPAVHVLADDELPTDAHFQVHLLETIDDNGAIVPGMGLLGQAAPPK